MTEQRFPRRTLLRLLGGAAAAAYWPFGRAADTAAAATTAACVPLTPEVTEGPYWIANHLTRRNITDGQKGLPLQLRLTVENVTTCKPIAGANVEVWHANALGVYSGYASGGLPSAGGHAQPTGDARYLRGHQLANADGLVVFDTIYPGWYHGRAPHIHVKVHVGGNTVHTGQLFFDDVLSDAVYRTPHYAPHGQPDTTDATDSIYHQEGGTRAILRIRKRATGGYIGSVTMGVHI